MSAVTAGVKDVREVIERARQRLGEHGRGTILFLDEIHRFSKSQQDALLPAVEDGTLTLIGATTENPFFEVNPPLRSRSTLFRLEPLDEAAIVELVRRGLEAEGDDGDATTPIDLLVDRAGGDGRQVLTSLEVACALAAPGPRRAAARRGRARHERAPVRPRRPLRRDQRVHQEHARQRPPGRGVLPGADARGGRGRPLHRPPDGHLRQRGHRHGRSRRRCWSRSPPPMRSSTSGCPRRSSTSSRRRSTWPRRRRATAPRWRSGTPGRRCATEPSARCPPTCATRTTRVPPRWATAPATSTLMTTPRVGSPSSTCRTSSSDERWYEPSEHGYEQEIARADAQDTPPTTTWSDGDDGRRAGARRRQPCCAHRLRGADRRARARARHAAGRCAARSTSLRAETRPLLAELRDVHRRSARAAIGRRPARPRSVRPRARLGGGDQRRGAGSGRVGARGVLSTPVIKTAGLATGTSRAVRRLRGGRGESHVPARKGVGMMKRVTWFLGGVAAGAAGAGYAKRKVKHGRRRACAGASRQGRRRHGARAGPATSPMPSARAGGRCGREARAARPPRRRVEHLADRLDDAATRSLVDGQPVEPGQVDRAPQRVSRSTRRAPPSARPWRRGVSRVAADRRRSSTICAPRSATTGCATGATELALYRRDASNIEGVAGGRVPPADDRRGAGRRARSPSLTTRRSSPAARAPAWRAARRRSTARS